MKSLKKWMAGVLAVLMLAGLCVPASAFASVYYEAKEEVNLRAGAGTVYAIRTSVPTGDVVEVVSTVNPEWWSVKYTNADGQSFAGFISSKYLKKSSKTTNKKKYYGTLGCYSAVVSLYLRSTPSSSAESKTTVPKNNVVNVTDTTNRYWYKATFINTKGKKYTGYLYAMNLKKAPEPYNVKSKTDLRAKASKSSKSLAKLPKGSYLKVTSYYSSTWYKVSYTDPQGETSVGYVMKKYLKKGTVTNKPYKQVDPQAETAKLNEQWLSSARYVVTGKETLRSKASKKGKKVSSVEKNAVVSVTSTSNKKWYKVIYNNKNNKKLVGYLPKGKLKKWTEKNSGWYVTKADTQLRTTDSQTGTVLAELPQYVKVKVTDTSEKNWYRAQYTDGDGETLYGFVYSKHLKKYVEKNAGEYAARVDTQLRTQPNNTADVVLELSAGTRVWVTSTMNPKWYEVTYENVGEEDSKRTGYVYSGHLERYQEQNAGEYVAVVETQLRTTASQTGNVVVSIPQNAKLTVISTYGEWYRAKYGSKTGFVYAPHLKTPEQIAQEKEKQAEQQPDNIPVTNQSEDKQKEVQQEQNVQDADKEKSGVEPQSEEVTAQEVEPEAAEEDTWESEPEASEESVQEAESESAVEEVETQSQLEDAA